MRVLGFLLCLVLGTYASAAGRPSLEQQKIDYLIAAVETLQGAQFIRNGKSYDAHAAADHLRLKLRAAGSRITTAEEFITYCASESSLSGMPYQIKFSDGRVVASAAFLHQKLADFARDGPAAP
jgi:hypothetical protein